jgi:hypothetical protein
MARFFYPYGNAAELSGKSYTVGGGTDGTQPTFTGDPMFYGEYTRVGNLVHFEITVDFNNITNFGTGQYYLTLPFDTSKTSTFSNGTLSDDSSGKFYHVYGVALEGQNQMQLWYSSSNGQGEPFDYNSPVTLDVADFFTIGGTYNV